MYMSKSTIKNQNSEIIFKGHICTTYIFKIDIDLIMSSNDGVNYVSYADYYKYVS